jgi:hypothetical protein
VPLPEPSIPPASQAGREGDDLGKELQHEIFSAAPGSRRRLGQGDHWIQRDEQLSERRTGRNHGASGSMRASSSRSQGWLGGSRDAQRAAGGGERLDERCEDGEARRVIGTRMVLGGRFSDARHFFTQLPSAREERGREKQQGKRWKKPSVRCDRSSTRGAAGARISTEGWMGELALWPRCAHNHKRCDEVETALTALPPVSQSPPSDVAP